MKGHRIAGVVPDSIADQMEIAPGDLLLSVNGYELKDVFDYHYLVNDEEITVLVQKPNGEQWELEIEKNVNEDLGIEFEQALLDNYRSCRNKCIFCFIDQMPPGMRETLYFKDDDARLSFLQGNYITLTNMSEEDIDRIIRFHLAPINVSIHTSNPELRCKMLNNRFAGDALEKIDKLAEAGIEMNSQIVLCKGINDGKELDRTIQDMANYYPAMQSLSVVPVGMSKYREGLAKLEKFEKEDAIAFLRQIEKWQEKFLDKFGSRFVHASDEWFLLAGREIPEADYYEGYGQIENGVGMVRSFLDEFHEELNQWLLSYKENYHECTVSVVTGKLFGPILKQCAEEMMEKIPKLKVHVYDIQNDFFGTDITVAGLVTGQDIIAQLKGAELGDILLVPETMLRNGEEVLLDDITVSEIAETLQIQAGIVKSDGASFVTGVLYQYDK